TPDVQGYPYDDVPFDVGLLRKALLDLGLADGRLGMELGPNQRLGLSYADIQSLLSDCPDLEIVDAGPQLEDLRTRKTDYEVSCLRHASDISLQAWDSAMGQVVPGMREDEIRRMIATELTRLGSDFDVAGHVSTA